jgi:hypothetical protein
MTSLDALAHVRREVARCQRNLAAGGRAEFWRKRLGDAAKRFEAAAAVLRMQLAAMDRLPEPPKKRE